MHTLVVSRGKISLLQLKAILNTVLRLLLWPIVVKFSYNTYAKEEAKSVKNGS